MMMARLVEEAIAQASEAVERNRKIIASGYFSEGYNKAIDDFVKMAKEVKYQDGALSDIDLEYIAQQLKECGTNGNSATDN